jgi:hypothetical protein
MYARAGLNAEAIVAKVFAAFSTRAPALQPALTADAVGHNGGGR